MKILIVDDHAALREGVKRLLATIPDVEILDAATAQEALTKMRKFQPNVTILDINLGGSSGLELLARLRGEQKNARIIMFTMYSEPSYVARALRAGALGYVSKSAPASELVMAVQKVAAGDRYLDKDIACDVVFATPGKDDPLEKLSNREMEILRLLGEGKSLTQIAATFGIAYKTVANSCSRLKEKLGLDRTADLIRFSLENRQR
jgi:DNA-binding NarL/FixJ family response regulator